MFGLPPTEPMRSYKLYNDKQVFQLGNFSSEVIHTPGHMLGSSVLFFSKTQQLFSGDLLFYDSIGRTDLWGGDSRQMTQSLRRIAELGERVRVFCGHGPMTSIGREKIYNPFLKAVLAGHEL
jgi:glyoxylase-like metal-dependent hydrolase (beta-lactamase superfamily II)